MMVVICLNIEFMAFCVGFLGCFVFKMIIITIIFDNLCEFTCNI